MTDKYQSVDIMQNSYNRTVSRNEPKFKLWRSVGIMLTYRCPASCACCYVFSSPEISDPGEISFELAYRSWQATISLAGEGGSIHLTGGEPFLRFELLKKLLKHAQKDQIGGLEKIETNAAWCSDDELTRRRMNELAELGITKLQISTDIYHQQFVPVDNLQRGIRIATEVLGPERVQVRWQNFADNPVHSENMNQTELDEAFKEALSKIPERMVGRAAELLASLVEHKSYDSLAGNNCFHSHLGAKGVHIDGWGNVFSSTCIGIITGKVSEKYSLKDLWLDYNFNNHPIWSILVYGGPWLLAENAKKLGFQPRANYASKCHLCYCVRKWLFKNGHFPEYLGPAICYNS